MKNYTPKIFIMLGLLLIVSPMLYGLQVVDTPIFSSGFESGTFDAWTGIALYGGGTITVQDTVKHNGTYAAKATHTGNGAEEWANYYKGGLNTAPTIFTRFCSQFSALPTVSEEYIGLQYLIDAGGNSIYSLYIKHRAGALKLGLRTFFPSVVDSFYDYAFKNDTWYWFEIKFYEHASAGEYRVYLDDNEVITMIGLDTSGALNSDKITLGLTGGNPTSPISIYFDDILVDDAYIGSLGTVPEPTRYQLTVNSAPVSSISYVVDSQNGITGQSLTLEEGSYVITLPSSVSSGNDTYTFNSWLDDSSTNPTRTINLIANTTLIASYNLVPPIETGNGFLEIHAFSGQEEVDAQISVATQNFSTTTSGSTIELAPGAYTVISYYGAETISQSATIVGGQVTRLDFQFSTEPERIITQTQLTLMIQLVGVAFVGLGVFYMRKKTKWG